MKVIFHLILIVTLGDSLVSLYSKINKLLALHQ